MTDHDAFERSVADIVMDAADTRVPDGALAEIISSTGRVRPLPRWLALIKERPMRHASRITVGSPTTRVAAIFAATLFLVALAGGAVFAGAHLLGPSPIIVSADGQGDFKTITAAVAAASDGDVIKVRPGHYAEDVRIIGVDLTIEGDGAQEPVVVQAATVQDGPPDDEEWARAFLFEDTSATVSDLTIIGEDGDVAIEVLGEQATPTLKRLHIPLGDGPEDGPMLLEWSEGAAGLLSESNIVATISVGTSAMPVFRDNTLEACIWVAGEGARPTIDDNHIFGCPRGFLVVIGDGFSESSLPAAAIITRNDFQLDDAAAGDRSKGNYAILVDRSIERTEIRDNTFHDTKQAIGVRSLGSAEIRDNVFEDNETAVWIEGDGAELSGNTVRRSSLYGLLVNGSPAIEDNTIEDNLIGINLGASALPVLEGNRLCNNETDLKVSGDNPTTLDGNEVCASAG